MSLLNEILDSRHDLPEDIEYNVYLGPRFWVRLRRELAQIGPFPASLGVEMFSPRDVILLMTDFGEVEVHSIREDWWYWGTEQPHDEPAYEPIRIRPGMAIEIVNGGFGPVHLTQTSP